MIGISLVVLPFNDGVKDGVVEEEGGSGTDKGVLSSSLVDILKTTLFGFCHYFLLGYRRV